MEWLGIIIIIAVSIFNSVKESNKAKQQREQRNNAGSQTVYRSDSGSVPTATQKAAGKPTAPAKQENDLFGKLSEFMGELTDMLDTDGKAAKAKPVQSNQTEKTTTKKKKKNTTSQPAKKSPSDLPRQTLMEQRPDREQREAHKKVSASVKPLKNAFDNQEQCGHRVELNPNIQYSSQKHEQAKKQAVVVRTDSEGLIQGWIWSEILGKPKAYQRRENKFQR